MKIQESGHGKNVANFNALIAYCESYGSFYNPGNAEISLDNLKLLQTKITLAFDQVNDAKAQYNDTINKREIAYKNLRGFLTKIVNALQACGCTQQKMNDARSIIRKVQGGKSKKKTEPNASDKEEDSSSSHSTSRSSYDNKLVTLKSLIALVQTEPNYHPNETELSIPGLQQLYQDLLNLTLEVHKIQAKIDKSRMERNELYYLSPDNLFTIASKVKSYVKSVYGPKSVQFRQLVRVRIANLAPAA